MNKFERGDRIRTIYDEYGTIISGDDNETSEYIVQLDNRTKKYWYTENELEFENKMVELALKIEREPLVKPGAFTVHIPQIGAALINKKEVPALIETLERVIKELKAV